MESGRQYGFLLRGSGERQYCSYAVSSEADFCPAKQGAKNRLPNDFLYSLYCANGRDSYDLEIRDYRDGKWSRQPDRSVFWRNPKELVYDRTPVDDVHHPLHALGRYRYNIVLFSAGIEGVPKEFDEAAAIDGAGAIRRFLSIKLPLMGRTFAFVAVMTMANYFQMFAQFRVFAPDGGMNDSVMVLTNYIYKTSFVSFHMGYASAVAAALFVIVFAVAMIQNKMMRADWSYE